jgi:hypothetical protein
VTPEEIPNIELNVLRKLRHRQPSAKPREGQKHEQVTPAEVSHLFPLLVPNYAADDSKGALNTSEPLDEIIGTRDLCLARKSSPLSDEAAQLLS